MPPTRPNLLVLVRHGQSERNVARKGNTFFPDDESRQALRGEADHRTPLTELGCQQARDAGHRIREQFGAFDYVYHSGYRRAAQTAEFMLEAYTAEEREALQVRHNLFLREREPGFAFDMTTAEAAAAFPWLQEYWDTSGRFFARPPGGESLADVAQRIMQTYRDQMIGIEGHTDSDPAVPGLGLSNAQLSNTQAMAVQAYLVTQARVPETHLFVAGHGGNHPVVSNATPAGKQRNRRVELVVYPEKAAR